MISNPNRRETQKHRNTHTHIHQKSIEHACASSSYSFGTQTLCWMWMSRRRLPRPAFRLTCHSNIATCNLSWVVSCLGCGPCCQASMRSLRAEVEETLRPLGCEHLPLRRCSPHSPRSPRSRISFSLRKNQGLPEDRIRRDQQLAALS